MYTKMNEVIISKQHQYLCGYTQNWGQTNNNTCCSLQMKPAGKKYIKNSVINLFSLSLIKMNIRCSKGNFF